MTQSAARPFKHEAAYPREPAARTLGIAALAAVSAAALLQAGRAIRAKPPARSSSMPEPRAAWPESREARALHGSAALLAASVLADSATEHYRGSFKNPGMYASLIGSVMTLLAGLSGAVGLGARRPVARAGAYATACGVGAAGTGFHLYNLLRRPGGPSWLNLFYSAPPGAPAALSLAGALGLAADRLERAPKADSARLLGWPAGRALAGLTGFGLAGTVGEAGLLHFRGAFQNPFMFAPLTAPPIAAALMLRAAISPLSDRRFPLTRLWLKATAVLGLVGVGFHAFGVSRAMGGWRNWTQNLIDGPPLPAPPSFSALAVAGLSALSLIEREHD
jgi:hypothetical protein